MIALCVDDEALLLRSLARRVEQSEGISDTVAFEDEDEALDWARSHDVDVAFLDIQLHRMSGMELAEKLIEVHPDLSVVFCTGYGQYATDAINMHIDAGYIVKPIDRDKLQKEIDHIASKKMKHRTLLKARCFGEFEVYSGTKPLSFKRSRTKELLAYLINQRGAIMSSNEICVALWEESGNDSRNRNYLYHLIADLRNTLEAAAASDVLITAPKGYAVDISRIDCDYYKALDGDKYAISTFSGEYMARYSWAEKTLAWLSANFADK